MHRHVYLEAQVHILEEYKGRSSALIGSLAVQSEVIPHTWDGT